MEKLFGGLPAGAVIAPGRFVGLRVGGEQVVFLEQAVSLDGIDPEVRMRCPLGDDAAPLVMGRIDAGLE